MTSYLAMLAAAATFGALARRAGGFPAGLEGALARLYVGFFTVSALALLIGSYSLGLIKLVIIVAAVSGLAYESFALSKRSASLCFEPRRLRAFEGVCAAFVVIELGLLLLASFAPVTSWDATVGHLAVARDYVREGRLYAHEGNAYTAYPQLMQALYAAALYGGAEASASLVSWTFAALACGSVYVLGKRLGGRKCGLMAAAMLTTAPIFTDQGTGPSIDVAFAGVTALALANIESWRRDGRPAPLILAAILGGASCGIRHTGYLTCALMFASVAALARERRAQTVILFTLVAAVSAAPWLLRSYLAVGNPFYPFLASVFTASPPDGQSLTLGAHESIRDRGLGWLLLFPWRIVMKPLEYDGWMKSPGSWVLLLGLPGVWFGGRRYAWLTAFCVAGGVCFYFFQQYARYILPFFVPMMTLAAYGARRMPLGRRTIQTLLFLSFVFGLALSVAATHFKLPAAIGLVDRDTYLASRVERYPAFIWANKNIPPAQTLLTLDMRSYYLDGPSYQNRDALLALVGLPLPEQLDWLEARGIRYLLYPEAYVAESPGFREKGLAQLFDAWRQDRHFQRLHTLELPRPKGGGTERVEFYHIRYDSRVDSQKTGS